MSKKSCVNYPSCSAHMKMVGDELSQIKQKLKPGHVIHTMISEHDLILGFLNELEIVNQTIQKMKIFKGEKEEFEKLKHIAKHLIEAEKHHQREEEVLFPELEKRGIFGPPQVMRAEHHDLRKYKKELNNLVKNMVKMDFNEFKRKLERMTNFIVPALRDHIFKENNILYPMALEVIKEKLIWQKMKSDCDKIGYCCFTPKM